MTSRYYQARHRLEILERWYELAIRPASIEECPEEDTDLLSSVREEADDLPLLKSRCLEARKQMNEHIFDAFKSLRIAMDNDLSPLPSRIPNAGLGLFFTPTKDSRHRTIRKDCVICHYWGHLHNFMSAQQLEDHSYLMLLQGQVLCDAGPLSQIKARYINDPINEAYINVVFRPKDDYCEVVALRDIHQGEELYVSYGKAYWTSQKCEPRILT